MTINGKTVQVQVGTANIQVTADGFTLYPYTIDTYGHTVYSMPQAASGKVFLNSLDTVKEIQSNYGYSRTMAFPTSPQIYRGTITTDTGSVTDSLYFIERTEVAYINCEVTVTST